MTEEKMQSQGPALPKNGMEAEKVSPAVGNDMAADKTLPEWKVSGIFSSHMVLQRNCPVKVWGWSSYIGEKVEAVWEGGKDSCAECAEGVVDEKGRFEVTFSPRPVNFEPSQMRIFSAHGCSVFTDILVGDVWLIGGQSNAELNLEPCLADTPEIAENFDENHPFRLFAQTQVGAMECTQFHHIPSRDIIRQEWCWQRPGEQASRSFSAIGYYLAHMIAPQIGVPLGMVMMCAGGACLRELMPVELAHKRGYKTGANVPVAGYYNTLIAPLIGLSFVGQVFFQGESEGIWEEMAHSYGEDLAAFVEDERQRFGVDFGFYNVQLSSYREECDDYFPHLYWVRASQYKGLSMIPNSCLAVARDLGSLPGEPDFAHSPHKYELAKRVAAQILAREYGIGSLENANSPMPVGVVRREDKVTVTFAYVNGGLNTGKMQESDVSVKGFSFMDEKGGEMPAKAQIITKDSVCVEIPEGAVIKEIHYAMNNMAYLEQADLCGGTGLPVPAFSAAVHGFEQ